MEIHPTPNPDYLANLNEKEVLIYSCGSLWTRYAIKGQKNFENRIHVFPVLSHVWLSEALLFRLHVRLNFVRRSFSVSVIGSNILCWLTPRLVNVENDRETERYTAVDYILSALTFTTVPDHADTASDSTITKTLNTNYETVPYGLGNASTTYPVSAFVTHLIYLEGANVPVDVMRITVSRYCKLRDDPTIQTRSRRLE